MGGRDVDDVGLAGDLAGRRPFCGVCGEVHVEVCEQRPLDVDRFCTRCGRRLDVQVMPTDVVATCRRCDGVHPARRGVSPGGA